MEEEEQKCKEEGGGQAKGWGVKAKERNTITGVRQRVRTSTDHCASQPPPPPWPSVVLPHPWKGGKEGASPEWVARSLAGSPWQDQLPSVNQRI